MKYCFINVAYDTVLCIVRKKFRTAIYGYGNAIHDGRFIFGVVQR